ncbi:MAG: radical SAM protein, partial [Chloroflexi bacterium]|nr:radical SAM protein [Chloroflexota bacterium]
RLVVDEMEIIHKELGFEKMNIVDDTFTVNHRHARNICEEIIRRNLHIQWTVFARVDTITQDLVELMHEAGCTHLLFGVESGSEQILKTINKGITVDDVRRGVKLTSEAGIKVFASFILGLPGESPETARQSVELAQELRSEYGSLYGFHLLSPLPGTELYEKAEEYGLRILTRNWAKYDANEPITETATMSPEKVMEIMAAYDGAVAYAWDEMKRQVEAGDPLHKEEVEGKFSQEFVWRLLKGDVIEKLGRIKASDTSGEELAQRVSRKLDVPLAEAQREMVRLVEKGVLELERASEGFIWKWS